jgi:hypothetical protein
LPRNTLAKHKPRDILPKQQRPTPRRRSTKGLFLGHIWPKLKLYESVQNFGIRASEGALVFFVLQRQIYLAAGCFNDGDAIASMMEMPSQITEFRACQNGQPSI